MAEREAVALQRTSTPSDVGFSAKVVPEINPNIEMTPGAAKNVLSIFASLFKHVLGSMVDTGDLSQAVVNNTAAVLDVSGPYVETDANGRLSFANSTSTLTWTNLVGSDTARGGIFPLPTNLTGAYYIDVDLTYTAGGFDGQHFFGPANADAAFTGANAFQGIEVGVGGARTMTGYDGADFGVTLALVVGTTYYCRFRRSAANLVNLDVFSTAAARNASTGGDGVLLATSKAAALGTAWDRVYLINNRVLGTATGSGTNRMGINGVPVQTEGTAMWSIGAVTGTVLSALALQSGGTITLAEVSANAGVNFTTVTLETRTAITVTGTNLQLRLTGTGTVTNRGLGWLYA